MTCMNVYNRCGWSAIETLIVIAIAGILATMSFAYMLRARPHARLEEAELRLSGVLAQGRNLAISEELATKVAFDIDGCEFWVEQQDRTTLVWSEATPHAVLPEGVFFGDTGVAFPSQEVRFTPRGTLLVGGSITITNSVGESSTLTGQLATGRFQPGGGHLR